MRRIRPVEIRRVEEAGLVFFFGSTEHGDMNRFPALGVLLASATAVRAHDSVVPHSHSVDPQTSDLFLLTLALVAAAGLAVWVIRSAARRRSDQEVQARARRR